MGVHSRPRHLGLYAVTILILGAFLFAQHSEWTAPALAQSKPPDVPGEPETRMTSRPTVEAAFQISLLQYRRRWPPALLKIAVYAVLAAESRFGIDSLVPLAFIAEESSMDPSSISPMGALGLAQMLPETAARVARANRIAYLGPDSLAEVEVSVMLAAAYLRELLDGFDNNLVAALTAYNRGPGATEKRYYRHGYSSEYAWKVMARLRSLQSGVTPLQPPPMLQRQTVPSFNSLEPSPPR